MDYYTKSLDLLEQTGDRFWIGYVSYSMGRLYKEQGNLEKALKFYDRAIAIGRELGSNFWLAEYLIETAKILVSLEKYHEAKALTEEGLALAKMTGYDDYRFWGKIVSAKIDVAFGEADALTPLYDMLEAISVDKLRAILHYELWKLETGERKKRHGEAALNLYRKLYEKTSNIRILRKIEELREEWKQNIK
jgi:tetratricopeptide (TPR) repeat protein